VGFLIDTNLWIAIERGRLSAADVHAITGQQPIYMSPINIAEVRFGIEMMRDPRQKQRAMATLRRMRRKPLLRISGETAEVFGVVASKLSRLKRSPEYRVQDLWLAAQALQRGFTVLTANGKDFKDVPGLKIIEIRMPRMDLSHPHSQVNGP
jgi:predicted nucleic acid-binding protein